MAGACELDRLTGCTTAMEHVYAHEGPGGKRHTARSARDQAIRMSAVCIGHDNPMNAITDNAYATAWRELACSLPRPRAILPISAHW